MRFVFLTLYLTIEKKKRILSDQNTRSFQFFSFDRAEQPLNMHNSKFPFTIHCVLLVYLETLKTQHFTSTVSFTGLI